MAVKIKTMTIRIPEDIYNFGSRLARNRRVSLNKLITESLEHELRREEEQHLFEAFTELGRDAEDTDVEFAIAAQREVIDNAER
jgi:hypothetical protein